MQSESWLAKNPYAGLLVYSTVGAAIAAVVFLSGWPDYQHTIRGGPIPLWYYLVPGALLLPVICAEPGRAVRISQEPLFWWFVAYVLSGLAWLLLAQDFLEEASHQWRVRVLAFFIFYTTTVFATDAKRPLVAIVIIGCMLLACAANWFDIMRPYRFVPKEMLEESVAGRGAGFFMNANVASSFLVISAIGILPFAPMRIRALVIIAAVAGVVPTFSRSGFIYAAVLIFGSLVFRLLNRFQAAIVLIGLPLLVAAALTSYDLLMSASDSANLDSVVRRLTWFEDREDDFSAQERKYAASHAWQMFLDEPISGHGIGATMLAALVVGPHNMYLMFMAEQGILGLALYVSLWGIVGVRGWNLAKMAAVAEDRDIGRGMMLCAAFLATYGFFSQNVLAEPQTIFIVAFLVAAGFQAARGSTAPAAAATPVMLRTHGIRVRG